MSFLELAIVIAIVGLLTVSAITTFGSSSLSNAGAEGFIRKLSLALVHARRATISTGDNHFLQFSPSASSATSFALFRRTSGGDVQVDASRPVPQNVVVNSSHTVLEFDFEGAGLAGYTVTVAGQQRTYNLTVVSLTGSVAIAETSP